MVLWRLRKELEPHFHSALGAVVLDDRNHPVSPVSNTNEEHRNIAKGGQRLLLDVQEVSDRRNTNTKRVRKTDGSTSENIQACPQRCEKRCPKPNRDRNPGLERDCGDLSTGRPYVNVSKISCANYVQY